jgi:hypothetical protein
MKMLSTITLFAICLFVLALPTSQAQVLRKAGSPTNITSAYPTSGSIKGAIYIKKTDIPNTTNINQVVVAVKQGLKAFQFIPQNNGLLSDQYIHVSKVQPIRATTQVKVKSSGNNFIIEYEIRQLPVMRPMVVKLTGNAAKNIRFAANPLLKNFPVAYLTSCDPTFECYNFQGTFIPYIH